MFYKKSENLAATSALVQAWRECILAIFLDILDLYITQTEKKIKEK